MFIAGGLGQIKTIPGTYEVPEVSDLSIDLSDEVKVRLESAALATNLHKTIPVNSVLTRSRAYLSNGWNRIQKYNGTNVRNAFVQAPVRPPTVTVDLSSIDALEHPKGVVATSTYLYVIDQKLLGASDRFIKMTHDGEVVAVVSDSNCVATYGCPLGVQSRFLYSPQNIHYDGTYIYIADTYQHRIVIWKESDFTYVTTIGSLGAGNTNFNQPYDVTTDGTYLYVADFLNTRICQWAISGWAWTANWTMPNDGAPTPYRPVSLTADPINSTLWIHANTMTPSNTLLVTDYLIGAGTANYFTYMHGSMVLGNLANIELDPTFTYAYGSTWGYRLCIWANNGHALPIASNRYELYGSDDEENNYVSSFWCLGIYIWLSDGLNRRLKKCDSSLLFVSKVTATLEWQSGGERTYGYTYVDEDDVESAMSPTAAEETPVTGVDDDLAGFHSTDLKVDRIRVYGSYLDAPDDLYRITEFANNPAGTTWAYTDTTADASLGDLEPRTDKRAGIYGLPPVCQIAEVWRDRLFMAGAFMAPNYSAGTANFAAAWDATRGLWKVTGTGTFWTLDFVGRTVYDAAEANAGTIVDVDETNQYLWLCTEWEGTKGSGIAYIIKDGRDPSTLYYSVSGAHEDIPATYFIPVGVGDGDRIVGLRARNERLFVFKRRSVWIITGTSYTNFTARKVTDAAGLDSPHSMVEFPTSAGGSILAFWKYPIIYAVGGGSDEPVPFSTFLDPVLAEASERAGERAVALVDRSAQLAVFSTGAPDDLANSDNFAFEYSVKRWCEEPGPRMSAGGEFVNRSGRRRPFYLDEWGVLWQYGVGTAEGLSAGDLSGEVGSYDPQTLSITQNLKDFEIGVCGVPVLLVKDDGTIERNVIIDSTAHTIYLAWEPTSDPDTDWSYLIAGIEHSLRTGHLDAGMIESVKRFKNLHVEYKDGSAKVRVDAAADEDALTRAAEVDCGEDSPESISLGGALRSYSGNTLNLRFSTWAAGEEWTLLAYAFRASLGREHAR
uniref:Uncharacterized protein n=1 Tax=viral metagenome TaxID=1070528 RepID=A0A6H1ZE19_9ZZZZ